MSKSAIPATPPDAVPKAVRAAIARMFAATIAALADDLRALLKEAGSGQREIEKAVAQFTKELIDMLAARVRNTLPPDAQPPSRGKRARS